MAIFFIPFEYLSGWGNNYFERVGVFWGGNLAVFSVYKFFNKATTQKQYNLKSMEYWIFGIASCNFIFT